MQEEDNVQGHGISEVVGGEPLGGGREGVNDAKVEVGIEREICQEVVERSQGHILGMRAKRAHESCSMPNVGSKIAPVREKRSADDFSVLGSCRIYDSAEEAREKSEKGIPSK